MVRGGAPVAHSVVEVDPPVVPLDVRLDGGDGSRRQHQEVQAPDVSQVRARVHDEQHGLQADVPLKTLEGRQVLQVAVPGHPQHHGVEAARRGVVVLKENKVNTRSHTTEGKRQQLKVKDKAPAVFRKS